MKAIIKTLALTSFVLLGTLTPGFASNDCGETYAIQETQRLIRLSAEAQTCMNQNLRIRLGYADLSEISNTLNITYQYFCGRKTGVREMRLGAVILDSKDCEVISAWDTDAKP